MTWTERLLSFLPDVLEPTQADRLWAERYAEHYGFEASWASWVRRFLALEELAVLNEEGGDSFSHWVREWFGVSEDSEYPDNRWGLRAIMGILFFHFTFRNEPW